MNSEGPGAGLGIDGFYFPAGNFVIAEEGLVAPLHALVKQVFGLAESAKVLFPMGQVMSR